MRMIIVQENSFRVVDMDICRSRKQAAKAEQIKTSWEQFLDRPQQPETAKKHRDDQLRMVLLMGLDEQLFGDEVERSDQPKGIEPRKNKALQCLHRAARPHAKWQLD